MITVSHDRYFLDNVVDRIFAFERDGILKQYEGGYTDYLGSCVKTASGSGKRGSEAGRRHEKRGKASAKDWKQNQPAKVKFSYKEQREFESIDGEIAELEEMIGSLEREILANATNSLKLSELMTQKEQAETKLEEKMDRWVYLNDLAEQMGMKTT